MTFTDPATVKAMEACLKDSDISSDQVTIVRDKADKADEEDKGSRALWWSFKSPRL